MSKGHGVGLVAHAHALQAILPGVLKGIADNALDTFAGVHIFLHSNLVRRIFLEEAAHPHVDAFGILPQDHQADIFFGTVP